MAEDTACKIQNVVVVLEDGRTGVFTGRMLLSQKEVGAIKIAALHFTQGIHLPLSFPFSAIVSAQDMEKERFDDSQRTR